MSCAHPFEVIFLKTMTSEQICEALNLLYLHHYFTRNAKEESKEMYTNHLLCKFISHVIFFDVCGSWNPPRYPVFCGQLFVRPSRTNLKSKLLVAKAFRDRLGYRYICMYVKVCAAKAFIQVFAGTKIYAYISA